MANQVGRIKTSKYATSAKLYNKTSGALVATSISLTTVGADDTYKEITFDSVAIGSYTLSVLIDTEPVHYDINVDVAATTWSVNAATASLSQSDVEGMRWRLGLNGTAVEPSAQGHFDLAEFLVDGIPYVAIPAGPIVRQDLDNVFGALNITMWADLDNDGNATTINNRITWALDLATNEVRGFLEGSTYKWADIVDHPITKHLIVLRAGITLYSPRAVSDEDSKQNPVRSHESRFEQIIKRIYSGNFSLVDKTKLCGTVPVVVSNES